jgi:thiamine transporter
MVIIAYRHGVGFGFACGAVYATLQQLLGLNTLSYVTGWQSVVAVILLDYVLAFSVVGLGGIFRRKDKSNSVADSPSGAQAKALMLGMIIVCAVRYTLHVIAGATVWAGLSIPTEAALIYSIGYNATYMIPETVVNALAAYWLGSVLDFSKALPIRFVRTDSTSQPPVLCGALTRFAWLSISFGVIFAVCSVFERLQDADDGKFTLEFLSLVNWTSVIVVCAVAAAVAAVLFTVSLALKFRAMKKN